MESSSKLLQQLLKDLSPHERKEAFTMFAVIGAEAFVQRHHEEVDFSLSSIKVEHAKCYSSLLKHYHQHDNRKKNGKNNESTSISYKKSIDNTSKQTRRHDGLKHYPVVDEFGSVMDVLKEAKVSGHPTSGPDAMEDPLLKHSIKKVFDEYKIGSNGLKACDLSKALEGIRTQQFDYAFLLHSDSFQEVESLSSHKLISFPQWTQIVRRRVQQHIKDSSLHDTLQTQDFSVGNDMYSLENKNDVDDDDVVFDDEEWVMLHDQPRSASVVDTHVHNPKGVGYLSSTAASKMHQVHPRPASKKYPTRGAKSSLADAAQARHDALQQAVQSSVRQKSFKLPTEGASGPAGESKVIQDTRAQILVDKRHAQRVRAARKTAAIRAIASSKVSYLPDHEDDHVPPRPSKQAGKSTTRKPSDINSGSAALDIADAFLSGTLGQQLLRADDTSEPFFKLGREVESSKGERNYSMNYKFEIGREEDTGGGNINGGKGEVEEKKDVANGSGEYEPIARYTQYSGNDKYQSCAPLYDNKGQRFQTSRPTGGEDRPGKGASDGGNYYSDNWRSTRGGWVADFGAPHTHTLSANDDGSSFGLDDEEEE